MTGTNATCSAGKSCGEATGVQSRLMKALRFAVEAGECTPAFANAVGHLLGEGDALAQDETVRVAHLVHRVMRAEANIDGADLSQTMRAPDIQVGREGIERVKLPKTVPSEVEFFQDLVHNRRSTPVFDFTPLSLQKLSATLALSFGNKGFARAYQRRDIPRRVLPSAGGLQSFDIQVIVNNVEALDLGLYHYDPLDHTLVLAEVGNFRTRIVETTFGANWLMHAQAVIGIVGNFSRVAWKYGSRGYRYMSLDAGVACGQVYLAATSMNLAVNAVAGFQDDAVNSLLRLNGRDHFIQLLVAIGNKPGVSDT